MSKPSWDDAPEWAKWLAADHTAGDQDEYWVWFEEEPVIMNGAFWYSYEGQWQQDKRFCSRSVEWTTSLEKRP